MKIPNVDLHVECVRASDQSVNEGARGVIVTHLPTGTTVFSDSARTIVLNIEISMRQLNDKLNRMVYEGRI